MGPGGGKKGKSQPRMEERGGGRVSQERANKPTCWAGSLIPRPPPLGVMEKKVGSLGTRLLGSVGSGSLPYTIARIWAIVRQIEMVSKDTQTYEI